MTRPVDDDRFELFAFWRTSAAFRVRVAFNLKGVRPRETFVDMDAGEQHGPAYRRISPLGGIPALIDHGPSSSSTSSIRSRRCCPPTRTAARACARSRRCSRPTPIR